ncbi:LytTR family DNA-binding domain-containing protein [Pararhodobacter oceanensis]|uniref:LytTR family DNA-binding domain-containing protein n=1 Tax=Pararhodobacter oceanensis TaxID=2172121 RepID=UPI003A946164
MDPAKPPFAHDPSPRATPSGAQLAYRELLGYLCNSRFWLILGGLILIISWAGPFNTLQRFNFPTRLIYWGATALFSSLIMTYLSIIGRRMAFARGIHWLPASIAVGILGILPVMALVHTVNMLTVPDLTHYRFWDLFPVVSVSVVLINVVVNALWGSHGARADLAGLNSGPDTGELIPAPERSATSLTTTADPAEITPAPPQPSATDAATDTATASGPDTPADTASEIPEEILANSLLFAKLPPELGRDIVVVQAQDHYIEVTTTKGSALILMRLSDVEQDLAGLDGMRVHRSWWVSLRHIERMEKGTSGPELRMSSGQMVPVSRGNRATMREFLHARS